MKKNQIFEVLDFIFRGLKASCKAAWLHGFKAAWTLA
jgi:hypothetical protein